MIFLLQRVGHAEVKIGGQLYSSINKGLLILVGIGNKDTEAKIEPLCGKALKLRIFPDHENKMNLSLLDIKAELLVVSQFTLLASTKKGNRPSYTEAARPEIARPLYEKVIKCFESKLGKTVAQGRFGADMQITLENDGPVTIYLHSEE